MAGSQTAVARGSQGPQVEGRSVSSSPPTALAVPRPATCRSLGGRGWTMSWRLRAPVAGTPAAAGASHWPIGAGTARGELCWTMHWALAKPARQARSCDLVRATSRPGQEGCHLPRRLLMWRPRAGGGSPLPRRGELTDPKPAPSQSGFAPRELAEPRPAQDGPDTFDVISWERVQTAIDYRVHVCVWGVDAEP